MNTLVSSITRSTTLNIVAPAIAALLLVVAPSTQANQPAPNQGTAKFETRFLTGMIDHHHMAVMMAELCPGRTTHAELMQLCESIRMSQMEEIEMMQGWLRDWYGVNYEPEMKPSDQRMMQDMAMMSGEEFEIEFMEMMIEHHSKAIKEAQKCERRAFHSELQQLCHNIISTQSQEISQMQRWLCTWYGRCK